MARLSASTFVELGRLALPLAQQNLNTLGTAERERLAVLGQSLAGLAHGRLGTPEA